MPQVLLLIVGFLAGYVFSKMLENNHEDGAKDRAPSQESHPAKEPTATASRREQAKVSPNPSIDLRAVAVAGAAMNHPQGEELLLQPHSSVADAKKGKTTTSPKKAKTKKRSVKKKSAKTADPVDAILPPTPTSTPVRKGRSVIQAQKEKKLRNMEKIVGHFSDHNAATNDEVQELLGVSDATATRYLAELELAGTIRQVGRSGRHVHYERVNH